jgi:hypothetical protein
MSPQMLSLTHAWSRLQKWMIVVVALIGFTLLGAGVYAFERSHRLPSARILVGTWEITTPHPTDSSTLLRLDSDHNGVWVRNYTDGRQGYSEIAWFAGGQYVYMRLMEGWPQIWQIVAILPGELRLRHARQDYILKRVRFD